MDNTRKTGFFSRLKEGLSKTRTSFVRGLEDIVVGERYISEEFYEELEELLIAADLGPAFAAELIEEMKFRTKRTELDSPEVLTGVMQDYMISILAPSDHPLHIPKDGLYTVMVVGVNGTGKTTTIGKVASYLKQDGYSIMLAAADTFRAAAVEQLEAWSRRTEAPLIKHSAGSDPSAVVFDAIRAARARNVNVLLIDTAGRLHTKTNLMDELKKIKRIMAREIPEAPHETLLVLDAVTGQNALAQAKMFNAEIGVSGLVLTKLDGTAKGGIVVRIAQELKLPIRFVGVGEGVDDLRPFNAGEFVNALMAPH
ncbi:MAG: signal recognition particle-docking protein FtsY [Syntrophales bacterium]|jgi:fused signal recognition particle receptor|nr:signal recognition particle-docking protein FtsY [Syntrophales bacterium]MCK9527847.1 signal recognition particle-docking protein FtsY [Syntrophales bacterium]MDX9922055.1 signal recognition particle-docking protein FtsY [Syntrophales bacterium]